MNKLININVAIDAICNEWCGVSHKDCKHPFNPETDDYYWCDGCETVLDTLPNLPPAPLYTEVEIQTMQDLEWSQMEKMYEIGKVERKKGKWLNRRIVYTDVHIATCDQCGKRVVVGNFCPNCGCQMNGGEQE